MFSEHCSQDGVVSRLSHTWLSLQPPSSLFIVCFVFLIQMASVIQRAHLFVSLSSTFAPTQSITQLRLSALPVMAYLCSTFVEHFPASRVKRLGVTVSTCFMFFKSGTKCSSCFTNVTHIACLTWNLVHTIGLVFVFHFVFWMHQYLSEVSVWSDS